MEVGVVVEADDVIVKPLPVPRALHGPEVLEADGVAGDAGVADSRGQLSDRRGEEGGFHEEAGVKKKS